MTLSTLCIGIVAGEKSGDALGAGLIREIKKTYPDAIFFGLGGEAMLAEGFQSFAPMERVSVMGLVEPLKRLPELIKIRSNLYRQFMLKQPDVVVGIDSPDFNLGLEKKLKRAGIKTCHYVCPSVWAWRQSRVKKIRASADHVLALLPFEAEFLKDHGIDSTFVGHPLADKLKPLSKQSVDNVKENNESQVTNEGDSEAIYSQVLCVMPGSRMSEVDALCESFLAAADLCLQANSDLQVIIPVATQEIAKSVEDYLNKPSMARLKNASFLRPCFKEGESQQCMTESDVILLASGTATLEAALLGKPMVVAYKMSSLGFAIASRLVKVHHIALPNLLLNQTVVPELIQDQATPQALAQALQQFLASESVRAETSEILLKVRQLLEKNANQQAADVVLSLSGYASQASTLNPVIESNK